MWQYKRTQGLSVFFKCKSYVSWICGTLQFEDTLTSAIWLAEEIWQFVTFARLSVFCNLSHTVRENKISSRQNKTCIIIYDIHVINLTEIVKLKLLQIIFVNFEEQFTHFVFFNAHTVHFVISTLPSNSYTFSVNLYYICKWLVKGEAICLFYQGHFLNQILSLLTTVVKISSPFYFLFSFYIIRQVSTEQCD